MKVLLLSFLSLFSLTIYGQVLASWDLNTDGTADAVGLNVMAGTFSEGSGVTTFTFAATGARAQSWTTGGLDPADYFTTSIAPDAGYVLKITDLNFGERRSGTGIRDYQVQYSKNASFSSPITIASVNVPDDTSERTGDIGGLNIIVGDGETLYFRWYGHTAEAGTGTWRINNGTLEIKGSAQLRDSDADVADASPQVMGAKIPSVANTTAQAVEVIALEIYDFGDTDGLPTEVTNIRITPGGTNTADWTDHIQGVVVKEGATTIGGGVTITDANIDIALAPAFIVADGAMRVLTLSVYLNTTNLVDNAVFSCRVATAGHGFTSLNTGTRFPATLSFGATSNSFDIDIEVSEMRFHVQPANVAKNAVMSPSVVVNFTDANGLIDKDYDVVGIGLVPVTLSPTGTTFSGTATTVANVIEGVASFSNLIFSTVATGATITITDPNSIAGSPVISNTFNVTAALPVNLLSFDAKVLNQSVLLSFSTAGEEDNSHFEIERSTNGRDYKLIGKIQGRGDNFEFLDYEFIDKKPLAGENYYRIRQVDFDGNFEYFGPLVVRFKGSNSGFVNVYPIPANDFLEVEIEENNLNQKTALHVFDLKGRKLLSKTIEGRSTSTSIDIQSLPRGHYFLRWINGHEVGQVRFVKQ